MRVNAIVPNLPTTQIAADRDFFIEFLGLTPTFDFGGVAGFQSPHTPAAQVHLMTGSDYPAIAVQVSDVVSAYEQAHERGYAIAYPLTQESHGPHHFWVKTPSGVLLNVIEHEARPTAGITQG